MSFKDVVRADIANVFLNPDEFADVRTIRFNGEVFENVRVVLTQIKQSERAVLIEQRGMMGNRDRMQGLYQATARLYVAADDIGGHVPEQGQRIDISDGDESNDWFRRYYVASASLDCGLLCVEMEATEE